MLEGLDWDVIKLRVADWPAETRERVLDLLGSVQLGARRGYSQMMRSARDG